MTDVPTQSIERRYSANPAYAVLVEGFRGSTAHPEHLAFLALRALERGAFTVTHGPEGEAS